MHSHLVTGSGPVLLILFGSFGLFLLSQVVRWRTFLLLCCCLVLLVHQLLIYSPTDHSFHQKSAAHWCCIAPMVILPVMLLIFLQLKQKDGPLFFQIFRPFQITPFILNKSPPFS